MRIEAAIACVGYDDLLQLTLGAAVRAVDRVTVVTAPWDERTPAVAGQLGANLLVTDAWRVRGTFNKARALNEWMASIAGAGEDTWLMALDADVLLPEDHALPRTGLDPESLYGAQRRMCAGQMEWKEYQESKRDLNSFPLERLPMFGGRLWGTVQARNEAGLLGYLQLWNPAHAKGWPRFREAPTASNYDVMFGLSFPENARRFLPGYEVLHLGPTRVNWAGRRSERWNQGYEVTAG